MPSNVFATTGTNVSVLFFDNSRTTKKVVLIDASKLGEEYKDGRNKKNRLRDFEIENIVSAFLKKKAIEDFSVTVTYKEIREKNYSLSAGQYFEIKIDYSEITSKEFHQMVAEHSRKLTEYFTEGKILEKEILSNLNKLKLVQE
jgi:type I restriction enzyme M protein